MTTTQTNQLQLIPDTVPGAEFDFLANSFFAGYPFVGPKPTAAFLESVRRFGILQPVLVSRQQSDTHPYHVHEGGRRIQAAIEAQLPIPAYIVDRGNHDVLRLIGNRQRRPNLAAEYASLKALLEQGHTREDITHAVGISATEQRKLLRLDGLHESLLWAMSNGAIKPTVAILAARLPRPLQEKLAARLGEKGRLKVSDVKELRLAQAQQAAAALPAQLFHSPAELDGSGWHATISAALQTMFHSAGVIPEDTPDVVRQSMLSLGRAILEVAGLADRIKGAQHE